MEIKLDSQNRTLCINQVRSSIEQYFIDPASDSKPAPNKVLAEKRGCFVTLHKGDRLRGCIGTFDESRELWTVLWEMAREAAFSDPRFPPVTPDEWPACDIEISVLTPRKRIHSPSEITVGTHGLTVRQGRRGGVLLPQVAVEYEWSVPEFLDHTCEKAGLPHSAWRPLQADGAFPASLEVETFTADVFR